MTNTANTETAAPRSGIDLVTLNMFLDMATDIAREKTKGMGTLMQLSLSERQVCLCWATSMTETENAAVSGNRTYAVSRMDVLRAALHEVREREGSIDLRRRVVLCREAGREIEI